MLGHLSTIWLIFIIALFTDWNHVVCDQQTSIENATQTQPQSSTYWKSVLGDICQLTSYPRSTADPTRFIECIKQDDANVTNRNDIGVWMLRECPPESVFVASLRKCLSIEEIIEWLRACSDIAQNNGLFCPGIESDKWHFVIGQSEQTCDCAEDTQNCTCSGSEVFSPIRVPNQQQRYRRDMPLASININLPTCSQCPSVSPNCICSNAQPQIPSVIIPKPGCDCPQTACICLHSKSQCKITSTNQNYCPQPVEPHLIIQPQVCPLGGVTTAQNAQYQGICSWMLEPLAVDPKGDTTYLQCQPSTNTDYCGRWQRMPCSPGTTFNVKIQLCVWNPDVQGTARNPNPSPVLPPQNPSPQSFPMPLSTNNCKCTNNALPISSCAQSYICPGLSLCQTECSICCHSAGWF